MVLFTVWEPKVSEAVLLLGQPFKISHMLMLAKAGVFCFLYHGNYFGKGYNTRVRTSGRV